MGQAGEGRSEENVVINWAVRCGEDGELLKVVPGSRMNPCVLGLVRLGSDKTCGVGDAESSNGAYVSEYCVVHGGRDQSVLRELFE